MATQSNQTGVRRWYAFAKQHSTLLWGVILIICGAAYIWQARDDFADAAILIADSHLGWIIAIAAAQLAALIFTGWTYQAVLRRLGHRLRLGRLVDLQLQRKVVGTITPGGGPASVYVFVRGLGRHDVSSDDALFTTGVKSLAGYASFVALMVPVIVLARPSGLILAGAAGAVAIFVLIASLVILLLHHDGLAARLARRLPERLAEMLQRARSHGLKLPDLTAPVSLALAGHLANAATLLVALQATGYSPSLTTVFVGYTVTTIFVSLSPVFQGIGIVEMTMAVTLQQLGVPAGAAIGATLLYRLATVWFPLLLGFGSQAGQRLPAGALAASTGARVRAVRARPASLRPAWHALRARAAHITSPGFRFRTVAVLAITVAAFGAPLLPQILDAFTSLRVTVVALLVVLAQFFA